MASPELVINETTALLAIFREPDNFNTIIKQIYNQNRQTLSK